MTAGGATGREKGVVLVLDGQGGGMGAQLVRLLIRDLPADWELLAAGTNAAATAAMLRAGAAQAATGENAVIYNAARADVILAPIGMILANGILGEVSPAMAAAVSGSPAAKILIPTATCGAYVAGTEDLRTEEYLRLAADRALAVMRD